MEDLYDRRLKEIRDLRKLNAELLELLNEYTERVAWVEILDLTKKAKAVIAKAEGRE